MINNYLRRFMAQKILIVDDDDGILEFMAAALEMSGYQVLLATSAAQAMEVFVENKVDLLLTDMRMPGGGSGADLLTLADLVDGKVPVIVMSGTISSKSMIPMGARVRYLDKPFTIDELKEAVKLSLLSQ